MDRRSQWVIFLEEGKVYSENFPFHTYSVEEASEKLTWPAN